MKRRSFLRAGAATIGMAALGGCARTTDGGADSVISTQTSVSSRSSSAVASPRGDRPVTVALIATGMDGPRVSLQIQLAIQRLHDSGEATNLTHTFIAPSKGDSFAIVEALKGAAAEDRQLDLILVSHEEQLQVFDQSDLLVPVDEMVRSDPEFDFANYFSSAEHLVTLDGRPKGLPLWIRPAALAYDERALTDAGVSPPDETWDWHKLLEESKKLTIGQPGASKERYGVVVPPLITPMLSYMWQNGGDVIDQGTKASLLLEPNAVEAVEYVRSMVFDHQVAPRLAAGADADSLSARFGQNGATVGGVPVAMAPVSFGGAFGASIATNRSERDGRVEVTVDVEVRVDEDGNAITSSLSPGSGIATLPRGAVDANVARMGGTIGVLSTTADTDAAWYGARQLAKALEPLGTIPARRIDASELKALDNSLSESEAKALILSAETARVPMYPIKNELLTILRDEVDVPVLRGDTEPRAALERASEEIKRLLQS